MLRLLPLLVAFLPMAGCLQDPPPALPPPPPAVDLWDAVNAAMAGVPCQADFGGDPAESTPNLKLLATLALPAAQEGLHTGMEVRDSLALQARSAGGFDVHSVADPLHPVRLGTFAHEAPSPSLAFSPDNRTALLGTPTGIVLVDLETPGTPVRVGAWNFSDTPGLPDVRPLAQGPPRLATARIGGTDWVFAAPDGGAGIVVLRLTGLPDARTLAYAGQAGPRLGAAGPAHGLAVQKDSLDAHWYLYVAGGASGWMAFNVDDPTQPFVAGGWTNPAQGESTDAILAQGVNGRRIVATAAAGGAGFLRVYDASDLRAPLLLGQYQAKSDGASADPASPGLSATQRQGGLAGAEGTLVLAYRAFGLYVFDLAAFTARPTTPVPPLLAPAAHWAVDAPGGAFGHWDAKVHQGVLYASWAEGGLLALGYGCHPRLPAPAFSSA